MPHSSRRKPIPPSQQHKRLEITDDAGWTHVTTSGNARRLRNQKTSTSAATDSSLLLVPADAPTGVTLETLEAQLHEYRQRWEQSPTWNKVEETLRRALNGSRTTSLEDGIVCIGLGSPSGFLRGGWVDRRSVSMYQLAALVSIMEWMRGNAQPTQVYAQDPVFNVQDKSLLVSHGITVVDNPLAFDKVTPQSLLFSPGAERKHLEQILPRNPAIVFGGPLEDIESDLVGKYLQTKDSVRLPRFEEQEHAFWNMSVYYSQEQQR